VAKFRGKAEVVDCQRIIVWNNKRYDKPVVTSHKVFPSVVAVYEAGCIKGELVFADVTYRFVTFVVYHCAADNALQGHKSE
jgi:hypothetical protein